MVLGCLQEQTAGMWCCRTSLFWLGASIISHSWSSPYLSQHGLPFTELRTPSLGLLMTPICGGSCLLSIHSRGSSSWPVSLLKASWETTCTCKHSTSFSAASLAENESMCQEWYKIRKMQHTSGSPRQVWCLRKRKKKSWSISSLHLG